MSEDYFMNARKIKPFTLIELLLVISIIMMLASMLLPALNKTRESSKKTLCTNNLKQFGQMVLLYSTDYNAYAIPARLAGTYWNYNSAIGDYGIAIKFYGAPAVYNVSNQISLCPSNPGRIGGSAVNYGIDYYMGYGTESAIAVPYKKISSIPNPSSFWAFSDAGWSYLSATYPQYVNANYGGTLGNKSFYYHNKGGNVLYLDGHVQWEKP